MADPKMKTGIVDHRQADVDRHAALLRADPLYLDRCQVDTPTNIVDLVWQQIRARRERLRVVVDFGAGDARFAAAGQFESYLGYEIDLDRTVGAARSRKVRMVTECAFSHRSQDADACVGNPPYVRNQDLPLGWRQMAAAQVEQRTGVVLSGLANAWQYFVMLGLWSVKDDGLVAQVLPFEWVSRPAAAPIRSFINHHKWGVDVYRLSDGVFDGVLTAASISVIDKRGPAGWRFHDLTPEGEAQPFTSAMGGLDDVLPYTPIRATDVRRAKRGLSPGTQHVLTLTEGERIHAGLHVRTDVVRCVTSMRPIPAEIVELDSDVFERYLVASGAKCWLIRTNREPSVRLNSYLDGVEEKHYQTATCLGRDKWWQFAWPPRLPQLLVAQAFKGPTPKTVVNAVKAVPVGGVAGIYNIDPARVAPLAIHLRQLQLRHRLVPYANDMQKLEINQLNSLLASAPLDIV